MKFYPLIFLVPLLLVQSCKKQDAVETDFIERGQYSRNTKIVGKRTSESGKNEIHFRLIPSEPNPGVFIRLAIADDEGYQGESSAAGRSIVWCQENGPKYLFKHRELFEKADEMRGKLFPMADFLITDPKDDFTMTEAEWEAEFGGDDVEVKE